MPARVGWPSRHEVSCALAEGHVLQREAESQDPELQHRLWQDCTWAVQGLESGPHRGTEHCRQVVWRQA